MIGSFEVHGDTPRDVTGTAPTVPHYTVYGVYTLESHRISSTNPRHRLRAFAPITPWQSDAV